MPLSVITRRLAQNGYRAAAAALGGAQPLSSGWLALAAAATAAPAGAAATALRALHAAAPLLASLQVKIPALGESISDGTVSAVLKQPGDRVEEDEPILQIETDKVTVDVRAPRAGVIEAILVQPDDNVEVGHVVASIGEGAGAAPQPAAAAPPPPPPPEQQQQQVPAAAAPAAAPAAVPAAAAPAAAAAAHRAPSIRFPPRRTPEGEQISALPREAAKQLLASLLAEAGIAVGAGATSAAPVPPQQPIPKEYRHMIAVPIVGGSMPVLRGPPVPSGPPGPPRRTITDREMEAIMLGGAEP